jgi:hypothetical protein
MFELYKSEHDGLGTMVEVYIDYDARLVRRHYTSSAITVNGNVTTKSETEIAEAFDWEVHWLRELESEWIPHTVDIDTKNKIITQEYTHPDLLSIKPRLHDLVPDITEQVVEMYKFFKSKNVLKRNGSLSNLTLRGDQLVAFDFKWARPAPIGLDMELKSYDAWLSKIDPSLRNSLREILL